MTNERFEDLSPPGKPPVPPYARYEKAEDGESILVSEITLDEKASFAAALSEYKNSVLAFDINACARFQSLFCRYGIETSSPVPEDWQKLAIRLAMRHREPGFLAAADPALSDIALSTKHEEHIARDRYIASFLMDHAGASVEKAAMSLSDYHRKRLRGWERFGVKLPTIAALRQQYSKRQSARTGSTVQRASSFLPRHITASLYLQKVVDYLSTTAARITKSPE